MAVTAKIIVFWLFRFISSPDEPGVITVQNTWLSGYFYNSNNKSKGLNKDRKILSNKVVDINICLKNWEYVYINFYLLSYIS